MPDPLSVLMGLGLLTVLGVVVAVARAERLRRAIEESARALEYERAKLARRHVRVGADHDPHAMEAEDRLRAISRLHSAQVRAWNGMDTRSWRLVRPLTRWRPVVDAKDRPSSTRDHQAARS